MCEKILPTSTMRDIWRTERRTSMLIVRLKGLLATTWLANHGKYKQRSELSHNQKQILVTGAKH